MPGGQRHLQFTLGRPKFQTGSPNGHLKLMILRLTSSEQKQNSLLILHHEMTTENVWSSAKGKKILPTIKGKRAALCLEIRFCDFRCWVVEVSRLKMALNELNSLRKNFDNQIMTFPSTLEMLLVTSAWSKNWQKVVIRGKATWFVITRDIRCKFVAFSILLRTRRYTQRFLLSLFYSAFSTPPYFLWHVLW